VKSTSILLADYHAIVRRGLRGLLESEPGWKVAAEASSGRDAVRKTGELHPDIVIVNINLPDMNGFDAARLILENWPQSQVLITAMHDADDLMEKAHAVGAHACVLKSDAEQDLIKAISAILQNTALVNPDTAKSDEEPNRRQKSSRKKLDGTELSPREKEIVQLLADGHSNKAVAARLGVSVRTVENHRAKIMRKLKLHSFSELVRHAIRNKITEL
jgi:DNA-binding NarL/FixJ family response regulator